MFTPPMGRPLPPDPGPQGSPSTLLFSATRLLFPPASPLHVMARTMLVDPGSPAGPPSGA
jgi:hypothetical protein